MPWTCEQLYFCCEPTVALFYFFFHCEPCLRNACSVGFICSFLVGLLNALQCSEAMWSDISGHRRTAGDISTHCPQISLEQSWLEKKEASSLHQARRNSGVAEHCSSYRMRKRKRNPALLSTRERNGSAWLLQILMEGNKTSSPCRYASAAARPCSTALSQATGPSTSNGNVGNFALVKLRSLAH